MQSDSLSNKFGLFQRKLEIWECSITQEKKLSSFKFGNSIPSTYIDTKLLYKYEHFFLENLQFDHVLGSPFSLLQTAGILCLKDYPRDFPAI